MNSSSTLEEFFIGFAAIYLTYIEIFERQVALTNTSYIYDIL